MLTVPNLPRNRVRRAESDDDVAEILPRIRLCRGHPVLFDVDLARIYGVPLPRLLDALQACSPLPGEFSFAVDREECVRASTFDPRLDGSRCVFTAHGAFLVAVVLRSSAATARRAAVLAAFTQWRAARR